MIKCLGCGVHIQNIDYTKEGYTKNLNNKLCERCFRITHYNEYIVSDKSNEEYLKKIDYIDSTDDLVILTVDFLNMIDFNQLNINNPIILVFTKRDILPSSVFENKFLKNVQTKLNVKDKMFISSKTNYNLDELLKKIEKYRTSENVYLVGLTNSGKSTLINKMIKNYGMDKEYVTVSNMPSTTLDFIEKKIGDITFIDTPGLLDEGSIILNCKKENMKKIVPNKRINPIIYQIKDKQIIVVEDFLRLDILQDNILVFYMSNSLKFQRYYKEKDILTQLPRHKVIIGDNEDLVIKGLGFVRFKKKCIIYLYSNIEFFVRKSIV